MCVYCIITCATATLQPPPVCVCRKQYNLDISDHEQPLLVHRPKKREKGVVGAEGGGEDADRVICLIPELCNMTGTVFVCVHVAMQSLSMVALPFLPLHLSPGLSDVARSDFRVMKDLAAYTRVPPAQREITFQKFLSSLSSNAAAMKELTSWGLQLDQSTVSVAGRMLPTEKVTFGGQNRVIQVRSLEGVPVRNRRPVRRVGREEGEVGPRGFLVLSMYSSV